MNYSFFQNRSIKNSFFYLKKKKMKIEDLSRKDQSMIEINALFSVTRL